MNSKYINKLLYVYNRVTLSNVKEHYKSSINKTEKLNSFPKNSQKKIHELIEFTEFVYKEKKYSHALIVLIG